MLRTGKIDKGLIVFITHTHKLAQLLAYAYVQKISHTCA